MDERIRLILKHLPPSAASLRLLDVEGSGGVALIQARRDLDVTTIKGAAVDWHLAPDAFDAVVALSYNPSFLRVCLAALRPGGRLIVIDSPQNVQEQQVASLELAGYTRILVEALGPQGVLLRGEKPHTHERTLDRIRAVAGTQPEIKTPYVHLLVRQIPNKPGWSLALGEVIEWQALALDLGHGPEILAFSSLPRAVAFMQPAVMQGLVDNINKMPKFRREAVQSWRLILNPELSILRTRQIIFCPVDPAYAEIPDE